MTEHGGIGREPLLQALTALACTATLVKDRRNNLAGNGAAQCAKACRR
jgi:hypothetical protein